MSVPWGFCPQARPPQQPTWPSFSLCGPSPRGPLTRALWVGGNLKEEVGKAVTWSTGISDAAGLYLHSPLVVGGTVTSLHSGSVVLPAELTGAG
jgi:hypothetical protein